MAKVKEVPGRLLSTRWCCREMPLWGRAGCPGIPTGENQPEAGGSPQGPASWPSTGRGAQTYSHPTMRSSIFGSNYREYRKPQLSSLFVFPGQRHSPYRATAGTWVKYSMVKHPHDEDRPPSPGLPREVVGLDDPHWFPPRQLTVPSPKKPHPPDFWGSRGPPRLPGPAPGAPQTQKPVHSLLGVTTFPLTNFDKVLWRGVQCSLENGISPLTNPAPPSKRAHLTSLLRPVGCFLTFL